MQNTCFSRLNWLTNESPKTFKPRFWKNFKIFFATGTYTRQPVMSESWMPWVGKTKKLFFLKILKIFQSLFHNLSRPLASESQKCRVANFWIFVKLFKSKYFPKTTKTLKNIFGFDQQMFEHVHHILIKYNHTNE